MVDVRGEWDLGCVERGRFNRRLLSKVLIEIVHVCTYVKEMALRMQCMQCKRDTN